MGLATIAGFWSSQSAPLGLRLSEWVMSIGISPGLANAFGVGTVVTSITYASLIIGELVPTIRMWLAP